ncbi:hypothetical protein [Bifidobacterium simiarum]|uniref:hypothetical protein n=1 Tax=Bifidobacterium simiarum TaxID=2045441 RepID=UPI001BDC1980|nr:hypothetical protein [Bifidobacterium simiarum]MBT1167259.1 hypothetical protein [Bifidobacterium simiarum]
MITTATKETRTSHRTPLISERAWTAVKTVLDGRRDPDTIDAGTLRMIDRAINARPGDRDALLMLAIDPTLTAADAMDRVRHPHRPDIVRRDADTLTTQWRNGVADPERARRGIALAKRINKDHSLRLSTIDETGMTVRLSAQALTIAAYLEWWTGDEAAAHADAILAQGEETDNTLAKIITRGIDRGARPHASH